MNNFTKHILVLGAGRSSTILIRYLLQQASCFGWHITIADQDHGLAFEKVGHHPQGAAIAFDLHKDGDQIRDYDLVISMLPPAMHTLVASLCIQYGIHMLTASYATQAIHELDEKAKNKNVLIMMECGLDPGLDHMSAMRMIDHIHANSGRVVSFRSYCGGLMAPESDDNPWHYKITWNPRNVVLAGQGGVAKYLDGGTVKYIPNHQLFKRTIPVQLPQGDSYEGYANRDSLSYQMLYGLSDIETLYRGTLRRPGFCKAWSMLVDLGLTDDSFEMNDIYGLSYKEFTGRFLSEVATPASLANFFRTTEDDLSIQALLWLGLVSDETITMHTGTPALVLQTKLEERWQLQPEDKDMIVMKHELVADYEGKRVAHENSLLLHGKNTLETAMATTVGLPLGIVAKLILTDKIKQRGVALPLDRTIYTPVLEELASLGIYFT